MIESKAYVKAKHLKERLGQDRTWAQFAEVLGVADSTIRAWKRGQEAAPTVIKFLNTLLWITNKTELEEYTDDLLEILERDF